MLKKIHTALMYNLNYKNKIFNISIMKNKTGGSLDSPGYFWQKIPFIMFFIIVVILGIFLD